MYTFFCPFKNVNFVGQCFLDVGCLNPWETIKADFDLQDKKREC